MVSMAPFCFNNAMTTFIEATVETRSNSRTTLLLSTGGKLTVPSSGLSAILLPQVKALVSIAPESETTLNREEIARLTLNELLSRGEE